MCETVPTQSRPRPFGHLRDQSNDGRIRRPSRLELLCEGEHELAIGELAVGELAIGELETGTIRRIRTRSVHRWSGGHGGSMHALTLAPASDIPQR